MPGKLLEAPETELWEILPLMVKSKIAWPDIEKPFYTDSK